MVLFAYDKLLIVAELLLLYRLLVELKLLQFYHLDLYSSAPDRNDLPAFSGKP